MFFIAVYIHIFRGLYYGSYKAPREVLWILGVFIFLAMMATAFLGYTLPWGQMSFWGVTVITNLFSSLDEVIPGLGTIIVTWLWGGYSVSGATLNRFFSLHYLLPFVIFGLVVLHVWALHVAGQNNPTGLDVKSKSETVPMSPFAISKDLFAMVVFLILFAWFVFFAPDYLGHADNYDPGQSAGHAGAHRAGMVLPAVLRDPACHSIETRRCDCDVRCCGDPCFRAVARYLAGAFGALSAVLQVVLLAVRFLLPCAGLSRCDAGGGCVRDVGSGVHLLLLRVFHSGDAVPVTMGDTLTHAGIDQ